MIVRPDWRIEAAERLSRWLGLAQGPRNFDELRGIDAGLVDGFLVHGAARASRALGRAGSRLQTGQVSAYLLLFLVGALWILRVVTR